MRLNSATKTPVWIEMARRHADSHVKDERRQIKKYIDISRDIDGERRDSHTEIIRSG